MCTGCGCPNCSCCCGCKCRICRSTVHECYEAYTSPPYPPHFVCFPCRKGWKVKPRDKLEEERKPLKYMRYFDVTPRCPSCGKDGSQVSYDFRLPKRRDVRAWTLAKKLYNLPLAEKENPIKRIYCPGCAKKDRMPYPQKI